MKLCDYGKNEVGQQLLVFHCPGCGYDHPFEVPRWNWNGSFDKPTFQPSLNCNKHDPKTQCHLFITEGKIHFQRDCHHSLAGQIVEVPDW